MKKRYVAVTLLMGVSAVVSPFAIMSAYNTRGYMAYGGEYLIVPMAAVAAAFILDIARDWDVYKAKNAIHKRKKYRERRRISFANRLYEQRNRA